MTFPRFTTPCRRLLLLGALLAVGLGAASAQSLTTVLGTVDGGEQGYVDCNIWYEWVWIDEDTGYWEEMQDCYWVHEYYWWVDLVQVQGTTSGCTIQLTVTFSDSHQEVFSLTGTGGNVYQDIFYTEFDPYPVSAAATHDFQITLTGPTEVCQNCPAVYTATATGACTDAIVWLRDGIVIGTGVNTITMQPSPGPDITITARSGTASASVTTHVLTKSVPPAPLSYGAFDVTNPPISSSFLVVSSGGDILGLTGGDNEVGGPIIQQAFHCNCSCTGWTLEATMRIAVTKFYYDMRINNAADIAAVSAAEGQHLQAYQDSMATITNDYNGTTRTAASQTDCLAIRSQFISLVNFRLNQMVAIQNSYDQSGGPHPTLGAAIKAHGGWTGP